MQDKEDYMTNAAGHLVPKSAIKAEDVLENDFVQELFHKARELHAELSYFKMHSFEQVDAFVALLAEKYEVQKGGTKGNMTFLSFDGRTKVQVQNADFIAFGPQLQIAKQLVDEFIKEKSATVDHDLQTIVFNAFQVGKEGAVNKENILGLRRLKITGDKWQRAMDAITDSIRVCDSKRYIRFYRREKAESDWVAVSLDMARA